MASSMAAMSRECAEDYNDDVDRIRQAEYPMLDRAPGTTYLDHAGTTLYPKSLIEDFSQRMLSTLYGNPHSASTASLSSTRQIDDVRTRALRFFNADPDDFDLVFVANATAGIKLVVDAFREQQPGGFWYGYHKDAHTSLVGVREAARAGHRCFMSDAEVDSWMEQGGNIEDEEEEESPSSEIPALFAYPAQSNMNGRRLPMDWSARLRTGPSAANRYSLLDAAALVSTAPLDLQDASRAPDFTVLSFYKIFGFPDLGALIVRKESGSILTKRGYFGGGTVEMVTCGKEAWHMPKQDSLHEQLEDGTLPIHSIIALDSAFKIHTRLYGSMERIAKHTRYLSRLLMARLEGLTHYNGRKVCEIYNAPSPPRGGGNAHGPIVALNLKDSRGRFISNTEVEKLANVRSIQLRSGGLCNPGGLASSLGLAPWELKRNFSAGQRCGNEHDVMDGKATGMLRISIGAMSNLQDIDTLVLFIEEFFTERSAPSTPPPRSQPLDGTAFYIESLNVYPVKSCGSWSVPENTPWRIREEGLAWDREWCIVHQGTRKALSQKKYPKMALIKPAIDLCEGLLRIRYHGPMPPSLPLEVSVPLSADPNVFALSSNDSPSQVCGDLVAVQVYKSATLRAFFSTLLDTPCTLARFPSSSSPGPEPLSYQTRHSKPHLASQRRVSTSNRALALLLSNESPILVISRSSINRLNEHIKRSNQRGKTVHASVFRANIIVAEANPTFGLERPYLEDEWTGLCIRRDGQSDTAGQRYANANTNRRSQRAASADSEGGENNTLWLDVLGGCRRCQMVCIDQNTAAKDEEPFTTLAKTRRRPGKGVFFGVHAALAGRPPPSTTHTGGDQGDDSGETAGLCGGGGVFQGQRNDHESSSRLIRVGDRVWPVSVPGVVEIGE